MIWLPPPSLVSKLDWRHTGSLKKRDELLTGEKRRGGGGGAESCYRKKAWSSINPSILADFYSAMFLCRCYRVVKKGGQHYIVPESTWQDNSSCNTQISVDQSTM
jgi:hypothetical protein